MTRPHPRILLLGLALTACARTQPPTPAPVLSAAVTAQAPARTHLHVDDEVKPDACADLDACIARLHFLALSGDDFHGLDLAAQALIARMSTMPEATPKLVALLADKDDSVAALAAAILADVPVLDPKYLPQVRSGLDRKLPWLPRALAHMDSDEAAREAVERYLVSEDAPENQENFAVARSGARALPFILQHARCKPACGKDDIYLLGATLREMDSVRAKAAAPLMDLAEARTTSKEVAEGALSLVEALGTDGLGVESRLLALSQKRPELEPAIEQALVGVHSDLAGEILASRLGGNDMDDVVLRDIFTLGKAGHSAGPKLLPLLHAPDWEVRIAAAQALGAIGYEPAADALAEAAANIEDVRLQWAAARALGQLRVERTKPALELLARTHWYPPVREEAAAALEHWRVREDGEEGSDSERRGIDRFWAWQYMGRSLPTCDKPAVVTRRVPGTLQWGDEADRIQLRSLAYAQPEQIPPMPPPPGAKPGWTPPKRPVRMVEPSVALRLDDGWLTGSDNGEWGGELMFIDDAGKATEVALHNIQGIHRLGSRVVVASGLAHMSNRGALYEAVRIDGKWVLKPWRGLPGAPGDNDITTYGELLVGTSMGGLILVSPDGRMRMAPCAP